jgi:hypothetical protein
MHSPTERRTFKDSNFVRAIARRLRAATCGGIGAIHELVGKPGQDCGIDAHIRLPKLRVLYWGLGDALKPIPRAYALPVGAPKPLVRSPAHEAATEQRRCPLGIKKPVFKDGEFPDTRPESEPAAELDRRPKYCNGSRRMAIVRRNPSVEEWERCRFEMVSAYRTGPMWRSTCALRSGCVAMEWPVGLHASGMISPFILRAPMLPRTDWKDKEQLRREAGCLLDDFFAHGGGRK